MPRVAKAVVVKLDSFPWYRYDKEFEWEDDENELAERTLPRFFDRYGNEHKERERYNEDGIV